MGIQICGNTGTSLYKARVVMFLPNQRVPQIVGLGLGLDSCGNIELWEHRHVPVQLKLWVVTFLPNQRGLRIALSGVLTVVCLTIVVLYLFCLSVERDSLSFLLKSV